MSDEARHAHVIISGIVQGVGFRQSTHKQALALGLSGWVRNLPNSNVEAIFSGEKSAVEQMLGWCRQGPVMSRVDQVDVNWEDVREEYVGFEIRF